MRTLKLFFISVFIFTFCSLQTNAQLGDRIGKAIKKTAEDATVRKAEEKTDEAVSKSIDKATNPDSYKSDNSGNEKKNQKKTDEYWACADCGHESNAGKFCTECGAKQPSSDNSWTCPDCGNGGNTGKFCTECGAKQTSEQGSGTSSNSSQTKTTQPRALESAYAKSDFVSGDEIIFADELDKEQMGEFPSRWDLINGSAELAKFAGYSAIYAEESATIAPLMKDMTAYLPDMFTVEFDFMIDDKGRAGTYTLEMFDGNERVIEVILGEYAPYCNVYWNYFTPSGEDRKGELESLAIKKGEWNHWAVSFNKRAFKLYINGARVVNIPSMKAPKKLFLHFRSDYRDGYPAAIKDFRMAQGAVPLYDRMMSDGKIISYGITFDVGKSTLKPESMTEINRIAQLMKDNPTVKFSVEGHTDNTGGGASNQTLSEARSKAVMDKLVEMGVDKSRLKAAGKGQNSPIADNTTDEGRAKNRRVEFVKF